ncbi:MULTISPECIES: hypothetical protein [Flavobacterium]|uniref:Uncharacterized protein n=1 Tax=Flavobacterium aurantiibacter TaxID=2023067 RepID=A0A256A151_9FLAO|nr:hypothetical protein [Flavobacterium aurantiibacter]OYQ46834.1 hypothetical protein CHX27_03795 [Flavobacterium aurantiibacter]
MNLVNTKVHGIIDYLFVGILWIAPFVLGLEEKAAIASASLGGIHLLVTALTNFELGLLRFIPIKIHSLIELIVPFVLVGFAVFLGEVESDFSRNYFLSVAFLVLLTWWITDYSTYIDYDNL